MGLPIVGRIVLGLLLAAVLAAPASSTAQDKPRSGGELIFVVPSEPPSYDAHEEETFGVIHPLAPFYSTLLKVDPFDKTGTKPVGDLAESWTISKDGMVYTFKLRKGVKFHDGSEMTSKDVKASYDKIIFPPPTVKSLRKTAYDVIEVVEAPDP
ncbi:MAG TPA: ABC transporter substrate-binding protein, partial [Methylomirabilota bacterium]